MKIKTKLSLLSSLFLIVLVTATVATVIYSIQKNAEEDIKRFRAEEMEHVKAELRDKVTMVYDSIASEYETMHKRSAIEERYGKRVKNVVESATALLENLNKKVERGEVKLHEAQQRAKEQIAAIRYDEGVGYLWINDTSKPYPKMLMHPLVTSLNNQVMDDEIWNTGLGNNTNIFVAFLDVTEQHGAGYVDYLWKKPTKDGKLTEMQPKISYVSLFKPWGWIIGTGIYVDDAETDGIAALKNQVATMRYDNGEGYFFIVSNEVPYPVTLLQPIAPMLEGQRMDNPKWNNIAFNKSEHLFTALVRATHNLQGEGFVDYLWTKPTPSGVTRENVPKLSFVKVFKPLGWVIGTGVYTDNIDVAVAAKKQQIEAQVKSLIKVILSIALGVLLLSLLASYWFANNLSKALGELTELTRDISLGKGLEEKIASTERKDEIGQLARAIERLQTSVKLMMKRMKR